MVTIFDKTINPTKRAVVSEEYVYSRIAEPKQKIKERILELRSIKSKKERDKKKKFFPVVAWGGVFTKPGIKYLQEVSNLIYFDCDKDIDPNLIKEESYVKALWKSSSGRGYGGVIQSTELDSIKYSNTYYHLKNEFAKKGIPFDNVSNLSRANFISYDPDIYVNEKADIYYPVIKKEEPVQMFSTIEVEDNVLLACRIAHKNTRENMRLNFVDGQKHNFTMYYTSLTVQFGVSLNDAYNFLVVKGDYSKDTYKKMQKMYKDWSTSFNTLVPYVKKKQ